MSTTVIASDFAARLRAARDEKGLRLDDAAYLARQMLPPSMPISRETIRRYETGRVSEREANPIYVIVLAAVYETSVSDLSELAATAAASLAEVINSRKSCLGMFADDQALAVSA